MENILQSPRFDEAYHRAGDMLARMTLTEKIGQLSQFGTSIYSNDENAHEDHFAEGKVGSYLTIKGAARTNEIQKTLLNATRLPIPALFADDVIHGYRTTFPTPLAQSASWNPEVARRGNEVAAKEAYRAGIKWTFAPMVDIARDPRWGRIMEGYGEDTYLCSRFAAAAVKGYQGEGDECLGRDRVMACMKHFVGYGAGIGGRDYNSADMSLQTLHDIYLPPFRAGLDAGACTFMTAFEDFNGVPATGNRYLLTEVLRGLMGFKGFVVSDAGAINELIPHGYAEDDRDAAYKSFYAGCDMLMSGDLFNDHLPALLEAGRITEEMIDKSVLSILVMKYLTGLMDEPYVAEDGEDCFFCEEHMQAAREAGVECPVLLENNGVLPLSKDVRKIAMVGPLACDDDDARGHLLGTWACLPDPSRTVTIPAALSRAMGDGVQITQHKGCTLDGDPVDMPATLAAANDADVIIAVMGERADWAGEAASRSDIALPQGQRDVVNALIATGKPVVLLIAAGRPVILTEFKDRVAAMMMIWQLGSEVGDAVADLLTGAVSPSGHATTTFPRCMGQIPMYYNSHNTGRPARGHWRFESRYMDCPTDPLYPFGYGLSYTEFSYEDIRLSGTDMTADGHIDVSLTVKNVGRYDGAAVVQLYVRDLVGCRVRPVKELKGFEKVFLKVGETANVTFRLEADALAFHDANMDRIVEPGAFKLWVAEHAADDRYEFDFKVV